MPLARRAALAASLRLARPATAATPAAAAAAAARAAATSHITNHGFTYHIAGDGIKRTMADLNCTTKSTIELMVAIADRIAKR